MNRRIIFSIIILSLFISFSFSSSYSNCHYSCQYCSSQYYAHCIECKDNKDIDALYNQDASGQFHNHITDYAWGSCIGKLDYVNALGIIMFLIFVPMFILIRNRTIFYFLNTIQTFALLSLVQIGYVQPLSYILQAFQYFMFLTSANKGNKNYSPTLYMQNRYRMSQFLLQYSFIVNVLPVFILSLVSFIIVFSIPFIRNYANRQKNLLKGITCFNVKKVINVLEIVFIMTFFFMIQQTVFVWSVGIFLDSQIQNGGGIVLMIIYGVMLAAMIVNICSKNMQFYPNKGEEQIQILKKCILPPFIILPVYVNGIIIPFMLLLALIGLFFNSVKGKEKKRTDFHEGLIKRQYRYRIVQIITILTIGIYWLVQKFGDSQGASMAIGVISFLLFLSYIICFMVQVIIQFYGKYKLKENQSLYQVDSAIISSIRAQKLEETLQNLQNNEQGIMEMIFFSRNNSQQKDKQKIITKNDKLGYNIKLTLQIQEDASYNHDNKDKLTTDNLSQHNKYEDKFFTKNKSSRTPKSRTSKMRLDNANLQVNAQYDYKDTLDIVQIQMNKQFITIQNNQKATQGNFTSRSQIKTGRQIKLVVQNLSEDNNSPRFQQDLHSIQNQPQTYEVKNQQSIDYKQQVQQVQQQHQNNNNQKSRQKQENKQKNKTKPKNRQMNNKNNNQKIRKAYGL